MSAELTGRWEKKLRKIERKEYEAKTFLEELKAMVSEIVMSVLRDNTARHVPVIVPTKEKSKGKKQ